MSDSELYKQIKSSLNAVSDDLRRTLARDVETLRAALDERCRAFEAIAGQSDDAFDRVVQGICDTASLQTEEAARQARLDAELVMQRTLDAARAEAEEELGRRRETFEAAHVALESELATARGRQGELASALADAEQELAETRRTCEDQAADLGKAGERIHALEEDHVQWTLARQVADAHVEEERQRRKTIAIQLETAEEELRLAKAEVRSCRLQMQQLYHRIQRLERAALPGEAASDIPTTDVRGSILDRLQQGLNALNEAQTAESILTTLVQLLDDQFATVALFIVSANRLKVWRPRHDDQDRAHFPAIALSSESPVARAARDRVLTFGHVAADTDDTADEHAASLPILASNRVIAVAYVEHLRERTDLDVALFTKMAVVLTDRVNHRLQRAPSFKSPPADRVLTSAAATPQSVQADSPHYVLARKARRIPIHDGVTILLNGVASALVDLSTLGAQIISPNAVQPNRSVGIVLPGDNGQLSCTARIVWSRLEQEQDNASIRWRAGLEFTEADAAAVEGFVAQYGENGLSTVPSKMH